MFRFNLILATDINNGIGKNNLLPWHLPSDLKHFQKQTFNNIIVMGYNTWKSLPDLKHRIKIVLTSKNLNEEKNTYFIKDYKEIDEIKKDYYSKKIFLIGGKSIFEYGFNNLHRCDDIYHTKIYHDFNCDVKINPFYFKVMDTSPFYFENNYYYHILYNNKQLDINNNDEENYLNTIKDIINTGTKINDRTNVGIIKKFGIMMKFNMKNNIFSLQTTRKIFIRGIIEELLWFLRGSTNAKELQDKNIHIWDGNSSQDFINKLNLPYIEGDCGPIYGFNFRHFGATYHDCNTNYSNQGFDQIKYIIDLINNEPTSRRMVINLWNPSQLNQVVLPPCHVIYQFDVDLENKLLNCCLYQRSSDIVLAGNYNQITAILLTHILCNLTHNKYQPGELTHFIANAHIYQNQIEGVKELLERKPKNYPILKINKKWENINEIKFEDFEILGYYPDDNIKLKMNV